MNFMYIAALVVFLFVLTYNPKPVKSENYKSSECCNNTTYRALDPTQCENTYYQGLQFGDPNYGCPAREPKECMGAIIGN